MNLSKRILSILLSLLFVVPLPLLTAGRAQAQTPRVYLDPTPLILNQVGASGTLKVKLENVPGSAGFEFKLSFAKEIVRIEALDLITPPAGVTLIPLKSINNEEGVVSFGALATCGGGACPTILSAPAVLATLTVAAVGEGKSDLAFDAAYILFGTQMGDSGLPARLNATLTNGQVRVGGTPPEGPTINLSSGGNRVIWPGGLADFSSLSALESIKTDCGGGGVVVRKKNGWWESAVYGYGGTDFGLRPNISYHIKIASACSWTP